MIKEVVDILAVGELLILHASEDAIRKLQYGCIVVGSVDEVLDVVVVDGADVDLLCTAIRHAVLYLIRILLPEPKVVIVRSE